MGNFVFNIALGRVGEFYNRVKSNDPGTSRFTILILQTTGIEADETLNNYDDIATLLAAANDEPTNTNYVRKYLTDSDLAAFPAPDDSPGNNLFNFDIPDIVWTGVLAGTNWSKLIVGYNADGADTTIIPMTAHDFVVTPNGADITAQIAAAGFYRATAV